MKRNADTKKLEWICQYINYGCLANLGMAQYLTYILAAIEGTV
jgi:hypothetical protein